MLYQLSYSHHRYRLYKQIVQTDCTNNDYSNSASVRRRRHHKRIVILTLSAVEGEGPASCRLRHTVYFCTDPQPNPDIIAGFNRYPQRSNSCAS
jgi:hypothetical protein